MIHGESQHAKGDIIKYLTETKKWIGNSREKELLYKTVESLANASETIHNLKNMDLKAMKNELNYYNKCFEQTEEFINEYEKTMPLASKIMKRGSQILDRKLKSLLEEIQEKAKTACWESQGTDTEEIARAVSREVQKWEIGSQEYLAPQIESLVFMFKSYIPNIEENSLILNRVDQILNEQDIVKQYTLLNNLIPQIIDIQVSKRTDSSFK